MWYEELNKWIESLPPGQKISIKAIALVGIFWLLYLERDKVKKTYKDIKFVLDGFLKNRQIFLPYAMRKLIEFVAFMTIIFVLAYVANHMFDSQLHRFGFIAIASVALIILWVAFSLNGNTSNSLKTSKQYAAIISSIQTEHPRLFQENKFTQFTPDSLHYCAICLNTMTDASKKQWIVLFANGRIMIRNVTDISKIRLHFKWSRNPTATDLGIFASIKAVNIALNDHAGETEPNITESIGLAATNVFLNNVLEVMLTKNGSTITGDRLDTVRAEILFTGSASVWVQPLWASTSDLGKVYTKNLASFVKDSMLFTHFSAADISVKNQISIM